MKAMIIDPTVLAGLGGVGVGQVVPASPPAPMNKIRITTKSPAQIDAEFDAAFKAVTPALRVKQLTVADRLAPYRKAIVKQRKRGMTWQQIAEVMSGPPIEEKVSAYSLKEAFSGRRSAAKPVPAPAPELVDDRLVLDPLTGKEIPHHLLPPLR